MSYKRWGTCLPKPILEVIAFLRQMAPDTIGLFRKNGVKSRIAELREICERGDDAFTEETKLHSSQVNYKFKKIYEKFYFWKVKMANF